MDLATPAKTEEFDPQTIVELDKTGGLMAIEMIKPSRVVLNRIAKKFGRWELGRVNLESLKGAIN